MPRPARLLIAALALVASSSPARAGAPPARVQAGGHAQRVRHHRRAKLEEPAGRAARDGSVATDRALVADHGSRHAPAERAESIGSPNEGFLKGGVHLDLSRPYFRVVPAYESGDVRWGLPQLINMIDRAARAVNKRFPGSVLDVGDISRRGGGDLLRHHSHESGRDADLGFYAVDAKNRQVHARTLIKFDPAMASPTVPGARYDLARNWTFVQELLTDPGARVSHIFIAEWVRRDLLGYARPRVSHALWERAAMVMMQPRDSLPHDDHIHVRISCPHEQRSSCIELAVNAPHGRGRVAHKGHLGGAHVLRTPVRLHPAQPGKTPAASATVAQDPLVLPQPEPTPGPVEIEPDVDSRGGGRTPD